MKVPGISVATGNSAGNDTGFVTAASNHSNLFYRWQPTAETVITVDSNGTLRASAYTDVCFLTGDKNNLNNKILINIENIQKGDKLLSYKLNDMDHIINL